MAYPIRLFDFQNEDGKRYGLDFLKKLDDNLIDLFGKITYKDTQRQIHRWKNGEIPSYLTELGIKTLQDVLKRLPEGEMKWKGNIGVYGRKTGTLIKREKDLMYRIIINIGDTEVYYLKGDKFNGEPVALPSGYALLCSPVMIDNVDINVKNESIRKGLDQKLVGLVPKIRGKDYLRTTIVLDLLMDGLTLHDSNEASVPLDEKDL